MRNTIETVMGAVVLLVAGVFLWLAYSVTGVESSSGIHLKAEFGRIDSLNKGDSVRISGITVGKVIATDLDTERFNASVTLSIDEGISLPADTAARIVSSSLLGGNHVELLPGFEEEYLSHGDTIYDTRDPISLPDLIGKAVFGVGGE